MRNYETIVIAKPDVNEGYVSGLSKKIDKVVTRKPGTLHKKDDWGLKRMAYEINHEKKGRYLFWSFTQQPSAIAEIERHLKFDENVVRHMTIMLGEDESDKPAKKPAAKSEKGKKAKS